MRCSLNNSTLIIISEHTKSLYQAYWSWDQTLKGNQNKILAESNTNVEVKRPI